MKKGSFLLLFAFVFMFSCNDPRKASKGNFAAIIAASKVPVMSVIKLNHLTEKLLDHHKKMIEHGLISAEAGVVNGFKRYRITIAPAGKKLSSSGLFGTASRSEWFVSERLQNVTVDSFSEPADFWGKKVCRAEFSADLVLLDWVDPEVFLPWKKTRRSGTATFALYDDGWKLENCSFGGNSLFIKPGGIDQEYRPAPPTPAEVKTLVLAWLDKNPHQVQMQGIYLPIHALRRTRMNPPGCSEWKTFSPLWEAKILKTSQKQDLPYSGNTSFTFDLADDKSFCYNRETRLWRIAESCDVNELPKCEADYDLEGEMAGYRIEFSLKFVDIYPWMLQYPEVFKTVNQIAQNKGCMDFKAYAAKNDSGSYYLKSLERKNYW